MCINQEKKNISTLRFFGRVLVLFTINIQRNILEIKRVDVPSPLPVHQRNAAKGNWSDQPTGSEKYWMLVIHLTVSLNCYKITDIWKSNWIFFQPKKTCCSDYSTRLVWMWRCVLWFLKGAWKMSGLTRDLYCKLSSRRRKHEKSVGGFIPLWLTKQTYYFP